MIRKGSLRLGPVTHTRPTRVTSPGALVGPTGREPLIAGIVVEQRRAARFSVVRSTGSTSTPPAMTSNCIGAASTRISPVAVFQVPVVIRPLPSPGAAIGIGSGNAEGSGTKKSGRTRGTRSPSAASKSASIRKLVPLGYRAVSPP